MSRRRSGPALLARPGALVGPFAALVVGLLVALLVGLAVVATFAPTGRFEDACGPWVAPDVSAAVREDERLLVEALESLGLPADEQYAVEPVGRSVIAGACRREHRIRAGLTAAPLLGVVVTLVVVARRRRTTAGPEGPDREPAPSS